MNHDMPIGKAFSDFKNIAYTSEYSLKGQPGKVGFKAAFKVVSARNEWLDDF